MKFPRRINISLQLDPELDELVRKLNRIIVDDGFTDIDFSTKALHIPHVTLLMGEVEDASDYAALLKACEEFARHETPFAYEITRPHLKRPSRHFVFVDTLPQAVFRAFRRALYDMAGEFLECEHHGGPDRPSHITIGYAKPVYPKLQKLMDTSCRIEGMARTIQICEAGSRGTCIKVLDRIPIGQRGAAAVAIKPHR